MKKISILGILTLAALAVPSTSLAVETKYKAVIEVRNGATSLGYIAPDVNYWTPLLTPDQAAALQVEFTVDGTGTVALTQINDNRGTFFAPVVGRDSTDSNIAAGSFNYLYLDPVASPGTPLNSTPQSVPSFFSTSTGLDKQTETTVWVVNIPALTVAPQWVNTDGSKPNTIVFVQSNHVYAGGDPTAFQARFPAPTTAVTLHLVILEAIPLVAAAPPTVTKVITADTLLVGQSTSMTITLTNPNAFAISGVALSDVFPAGLVPSDVTSSCVGGTLTIVNQTIGITGVNLPAAPGPGNQCTISATVTANGAALGSLTNTTSAVTSTDPATTGLTASDTVRVLARPLLTKAFAPANIQIAGTSTMSFSFTNANGSPITSLAFTDPFPAGLIVRQTPNVTNTCGGTFTALPNATSVSLTGGTIAANSSCTITLTVQGTTPGTKVNTTSAVTAISGGDTVNGDAATATLVVGESQVSFLIRYAANLNIGESVVNFTNTGESSTTSFGPTFAQNGELCANVFAYSPDEQLVSCCSCNVTPNALNSLSVKADLGTNTLTPIIPSSLVIKVVATQGGAACTASSAATVNTAVLQPGLAAWGTSLHALPAAGGTGAGTYGVAETPFSLATISQAELQRMAQLCSFIRANGSGYGICKSCKVGGLGASAK